MISDISTEEALKFFSSAHSEFGKNVFHMNQLNDSEETPKLINEHLKASKKTKTSLSNSRRRSTYIHSNTNTSRSSRSKRKVSKSSKSSLPQTPIPIRNVNLMMGTLSHNHTQKAEQKTQFNSKSAHRSKNTDSSPLNSINISNILQKSSNELLESEVLSNNNNISLQEMGPEEKQKYYQEAQELIRRANIICSQLPEFKKNHEVDNLLLQCMDKLNKSTVFRKENKENLNMGNMNRSHSNIRSRKGSRKRQAHFFEPIKNSTWKGLSLKSSSRSNSRTSDRSLIFGKQRRSKIIQRNKEILEESKQLYFKRKHPKNQKSSRYPHKTHRNNTSHSLTLAFTPNPSKNIDKASKSRSKSRNRRRHKLHDLNSRKPNRPNLSVSVRNIKRSLEKTIPGKKLRSKYSRNHSLLLGGFRKNNHRSKNHKQTLLNSELHYSEVTSKNTTSKVKLQQKNQHLRDDNDVNLKGQFNRLRIHIQKKVEAGKKKRFDS